MAGKKVPRKNLPTPSVQVSSAQGLRGRLHALAPLPASVKGRSGLPRAYTLHVQGQEKENMPGVKGRGGSQRSQETLQIEI